MEGSVWVGMGSLAITMVLAITGAAVTLGRLMADVQNLTSVVEKLVSESRADNEGLVEMRSLVATLRETVGGLQDTLRTGFANRLALLERRLDVLESAHHRNHGD